MADRPQGVSPQSLVWLWKRHVSLPGKGISALPQVQNDPIHVHCDYLELLVEYGIVGVVLAVGFLVFHLRSGFRGVGEIVRTRA